MGQTTTTNIDSETLLQSHFNLLTLLGYGCSKNSETSFRCEEADNSKRNYIGSNVSQIQKNVSDRVLRKIYWGYGCGKTPHQKWAHGVYAYAPARPPKFYVVSYTNKTGDLEALFEISYFWLTPKRKCHICCSYGPTNLHDTVWGHAASVCPRYKTSILWVYSTKIEKLEAL